MIAGRGTTYTRGGAQGRGILRMLRWTAALRKIRSGSRGFASTHFRRGLAAVSARVPSSTFVPKKHYNATERTLRGMRNDTSRRYPPENETDVPRNDWLRNVQYRFNDSTIETSYSVRERCHAGEDW